MHSVCAHVRRAAPRLVPGGYDFHDTPRFICIMMVYKYYNRYIRITIYVYCDIFTRARASKRACRRRRRGRAWRGRRSRRAPPAAAPAAPRGTAACITDIIYIYIYIYLIVSSYHILVRFSASSSASRAARYCRVHFVSGIYKKVRGYYRH